MKDSYGSYSTFGLFLLALKSYKFWIYKWFWKEIVFTKVHWSSRKYCSLFHRYLCRMANHPDGIGYYNPNGFEPDYHCRSCHDDLG